MKRGKNFTKNSENFTKKLKVQEKL